MSAQTPPSTSTDASSKSIPGAAHLNIATGLATIAAGMTGYSKSKSTASLIGGTGIATCYLYSAYLMREGHMKEGHLFAACASGVLLMIMGPRYLRGAGFMPTGLMATTGGLVGAYNFKKFADWSQND